MCNLKAKNYVEFPFTFCLPSLRSLGGNKNLYLDDSVFFYLIGFLIGSGWD